MFSIKTCFQCKYIEGIQHLNSNRLFPEPTVFSRCILTENRFSYPVGAIQVRENVLNENMFSMQIYQGIQQYRIFSMYSH